VSAVPTEIDLHEAPRSPSGEGRLPTIALVYYVVVAAATVAATAPYLGRLTEHTHGLITFAILAVCAAIAQLFVVVTPRRGRQSEGTLSYHTTAVFLLPVALLLTPGLAALVAVVSRDNLKVGANENKLKIVDPSAAIICSQLASIASVCSLPSTARIWVTIAMYVFDPIILCISPPLSASASPPSRPAVTSPALSASAARCNRVMTLSSLLRSEESVAVHVHVVQPVRS